MEIAVISGKGGTGKSVITAAFASLAQKVVLADCDVDAANQYLLFDPSRDAEEVYISGQTAVIDYDLCTSCGICIDYCRFEAISRSGNRVEISDVSCDGCFLCSRVCPETAISMVDNDQSRMYSGGFRYGDMVYGRLAPGEDNSGKLVAMVREKAAKLASEKETRVILIDGPPGIGCPVISAITGVNLVVIVTEPSLSGLHDLKRVVSVTRKMERPLCVIVNKWDLNPDMSGTIEAWCEENEIRVAGKIPFSEMITRAMVNKKTIPEWDPENEITHIIRSIFERLEKDNLSGSL